VVEAVLAAAGRGGVFNVGSGTETTVNELHRLCAEIAGAERAPTHVGARPGDARRSVLDSSLAGRELGWQARTSLEAGLRATWESSS
jgi:UDP-glucose 4-epimerase